ncbi:hypothetical protein [Sphingobacterium sp. SGR-19]|uniref:hypothetical protein n=1 Tax=Sphingobacterium sp. SGR-19 TaxID=2710886 RepID=UPI0013EC51FB|nr:hypothetical protein [Sphingobacterium sp. SGR-19]NGM65421.1 hypothetical protein [Sphingobacterium sp. SGR-19]
MKKFIIKNAMALVALAIAGTTLMSFGLEYSSDTQSLHWYEKNEATGEYTPSPGNQPPSECEPNPSNPICALAFTEEQTEVDDSMETIAEVVLNRSN